MTSAALQPSYPRQLDAVALLRLVLSWLLVTVLAVDLVTSPLHTHRHDGERSAGASLAAPAEHPSDLLGSSSIGVPTHIDHDEAPEFSHSISTLRSAAEVAAAAPSSDQPSADAPWLIPALASSGRAIAFVWPPDRHRAGSSAFRSLPPHGRAPPFHA